MAPAQFGRTEGIASQLEAGFLVVPMQLIRKNNCYRDCRATKIAVSYLRCVGTAILVLDLGAGPEPGTLCGSYPLYQPGRNLFTV
jgi:hypothetical protein